MIALLVSLLLALSPYPPAGQAGHCLMWELRDGQQNCLQWQITATVNPNEISPRTYDYSFSEQAAVPDPLPLPSSAVLVGAALAGVVILYAIRGK